MSKLVQNRYIKSVILVLIVVKFIDTLSNVNLVVYYIFY